MEDYIMKTYLVTGGYLRREAGRSNLCKGGQTVSGISKLIPKQKDTLALSYFK
jgi:hypothetical protein